MVPISIEPERQLGLITYLVAHGCSIDIESI